jgi:hypothetical protein
VGNDYNDKKQQQQQEEDVKTNRRARAQRGRRDVDAAGKQGDVR